jgi:hypothetical protein
MQSVIYETPKWSTPSGEMGFENYADGPRERGTNLPRWWVRATDDEKLSGINFDLAITSDPDRIKGKIKVARIPGVLVFSEFKDLQAGTVIREPSTIDKLERIKTIPGEPLPTKSIGMKG